MTTLAGAIDGAHLHTLQAFVVDHTKKKLRNRALPIVFLYFLNGVHGNCARCAPDLC